MNNYNNFYIINYKNNEFFKWNRYFINFENCVENYFEFLINFSQMFEKFVFW